MIRIILIFINTYTYTYTYIYIIFIYLNIFYIYFCYFKNYIYNVSQILESSFKCTNFVALNIDKESKLRRKNKDRIKIVKLASSFRSEYYK